MKELIDSLRADYKFVGSSYDKQGRFVSSYRLYSKTMSLFPTEVDKLKKIFPEFNFTKLYGNYYIIGFNKKK